MKTSQSKSGQRWWMWATIVASLLLMNSAFAPAQDAKNAGTEKAAPGAAADNPAAAPNPSTDKPTAAPASDNQAAAPTAGAKLAEVPPATKNTPLAEKSAEETPANKAPASVTSAPDQKAAPPATAAPETKNASDSSLPAGKSDDSIAAKAAEGT